MNLTTEVILKLLKDIADSSRCISRQTAAIIVDNDGIICGYGSNGSSTNIVSCVNTNHCLRKNFDVGHGLENCISVHAEERAILMALRRGAINGYSMYCTDRPCIFCLKPIVETGIRHVFYIREYDSAENAAYSLLSKQVIMTQITCEEIELLKGRR